MDFIKYQAGHIESVLGSRFRRQYLVEPGIAVVDDPLPGRPYLGTASGPGSSDHLPCIKDDGCLVAVAGCAIHFRTRFIIGIQKVQGDSGGQLALPVLLWNLYRPSGTAASVLLDDAEQITQSVPARAIKERLPGRSFGMTDSR